MPDDAVHELAVTRRRIEQLEAALMRRTELLGQKQSELAAVKASKAYRAAHFVNKLIDRLFPLHTRRRTLLKRIGRRLGSVPVALWSRRKRKDGPPPDERYLSECTPPEEYGRWIKKYEPDAAELKRQRGHKFARSPKVSVVVPVYNPPAAFLEAMIESVRGQTYGNWELCLADGASTEPHVRPLLEAAAKSDPRIKVSFLPTNGGIVGNSNAAAGLAT